MLCVKCERDLPENEFYVESRAARGRTSRCKQCIKNVRAARIQENLRTGVSSGRRCSRCGEIKPAAEYHLNLSAVGGLQPHCKSCDRLGYARDRESKLAGSRRYKRRRYAEDAGFRLRSIMSSALSAFVRGEFGSGPRKSFRALARRTGISGEEFMAALRAKLGSGMTEQNYGRVWELDHVLAVAGFDHRDPEQVKRCWHPDNIRPAFAADNRARGPHGKSSLRILHT